jgi:Fic family protein
MSMSTRIGRLVKHTTRDEEYYTYIPALLQPSPPLDMSKIQPSFDRAQQALAELKVATAIIPNVSLFMYMYVRKEALLSSQIEGTQSSFSDLMLFENNQQPSVTIDDVEEVSNYVSAVKHGLRRMREGMPLSLRLIKEMHGILLQGTRGAQKMPGAFRTSQNWIGGSRPGTALFVPPSPEDLMDCLGAFENFLHDKKTGLAPLLRIGLAHVQFETIHPFLDGNGRIGRVLISLLLCHYGLLDEPVLYLSLYLKQNRLLYYDLLQRVREHGDWERWLEFFLDGVSATATQAILTAQKINVLFAADALTIESMGRIRFSVREVWEAFKKLPQLSVPILSTTFHMHPATARDALVALESAAIIREITGKKRDRVYVYTQYLDLLEG